MTRSKYYAWRDQGRESKRARSDRRLLVMIRSLHQEWDGLTTFLQGYFQDFPHSFENSPVVD
ncbi:MAG: hypothetical protein F4227_10250 [Gammaproteobacteria bacterium]|nr:hypothetical protein [Gammaproteobacteria bacterium]MYF03320.1 hypothetical protein [Gammaproteobacteria bacterium]